MTGRLAGAVAFLLIALSAPALASAAERYAAIVSGASGGGKYADQQREWRTELAASLGRTFQFPEDHVLVLAEDAAGPSRSTAANVRALFDGLRGRLGSDDTLMVVLIGHGTFDGADAKFNLVGPDLTAAEWNSLLADLPGRLVLVNTTASSFPFIEELSRRGRVVITATDSIAQRFATVFPQYFVRVFADLTADYDKNGRISVWEAFTAASTAVKAHYEQRGQLSTERPLLDDDGDRVGREFEAPGSDGALARAIDLDAPARTVTADAGVLALERQRSAVETEIADLKLRKPGMSVQEYEDALERLLLQLARITRQIRQRS